uniref:Cytochrome P450 CYP3-like member 3 n=1 Tax=Phallusia mammillata TaxID=59560 RepID=A0A6F9DAA7_9ASCI|nr:cytochrome P450 CYP3-like member 3 [Phallusia mammillata]
MYSPLDILSLETWILLGTAFLVARYYVNRQFQILKKCNIPHEPMSIMKLASLIKDRKKPDGYFTKTLEIKEKYGRIYGYYVGLNIRVMIYDPEILKQIQIKESGIFRDRRHTFTRCAGKEMNTSLTAAKGNHWKRIRTTISPMFSIAKIKEMFVLVENCTDKMVETLNEISTNDKGLFLPKDVLHKLSLDVICSSAFNVDMHTQESKTEELQMLKMGRKLFDIQVVGSVLLGMFVLFPSLERIAELVNYSLFPADSIKYFAGLVDAVIKNKDYDKSRADLMTLMLKAKISEKKAKTAEKGLTRNEIVGNSIQMILAGFETTGNTMLFVIYNLAIYKDAQKKARQEVKEVVEKHEGLTYEAIMSLKYVTQCINETLRLYPAIVVNSRYCEKEVTIQGVTIPKDCHIEIHNYAFGRDEEYWENPTLFNPDRMEDMSKINPIVFQPFGAGPRNCIGMRFAMIEMKMAISKILLNFELDTCPDTPKPPIDITFKASVQPKEKIPLKIRRLKSSE